MATTTTMHNESIETVSDLMQALQNEINAIKDGTLEESKARLVFKGRAHQLKTAELQLQYARLTKGRVPDPELRLITLRKEPKKEGDVIS